MLTIIVPARNEAWDEKNQMFVSTKEQTLCLEHSLVSLSKWEAKWHIPFLCDKEKTSEQVLDYIKCMTLTQNVDDYVYNCLTPENLKDINNYIEDKRTATTFTDRRKPGAPSKSKELITSELVYYWMIAYQIPFECQRWHLNRLLVLIRICSIKNDTGKKMSQSETLSSYRALNEARKKQFNTRG